MKIEILTTPGCSNCSVVEKMLDEMKVSYEVIDVTEKPEYLEKYPIFTALPKKEKLIEKINQT